MLAQNLPLLNILNAVYNYYMSGSSIHFYPCRFLEYSAEFCEHVINIQFRDERTHSKNIRFSAHPSGKLVA